MMAPLYPGLLCGCIMRTSRERWWAGGGQGETGDCGSFTGLFWCTVQNCDIKQLEDFAYSPFDDTLVCLGFFVSNVGSADIKTNAKTVNNGFIFSQQQVP